MTLFLTGCFLFLASWLFFALGGQTISPASSLTVRLVHMPFPVGVFFLSFDDLSFGFPLALYELHCFFL